MKNQIAYLAGRILRRIKLCRVQSRPGRDGLPRVFIKSRRWYGPGLIRLSRKLQICPDIVPLEPEAWLRRESDLWRILHGIFLDPCGQCLATPSLPGIPLDELLKSSEVDSAQKLKAFEQALQALRSAHQIQIKNSTGVVERFSHGDAHCGNVMIEPASATARWYDFEVEHRAGMSSARRHADDLRAFTFSAAACLDPGLFGAIATTLVKFYERAEVLEELQRIVAGLSLRPSLLHFSQASLTRNHHDQLVGHLMRVL